VNGIKLPLTLSVAGHAACLALLVLFLTGKPAALPKPIAKGGIEVVFEAPPPKPEAAPPAETTPPPPEPEPQAVPPPPEPPVVAAEPPPPEAPPPEPPPPQPEAPVAASEPPPPPPPLPQKQVVKKVPKPAPRHQEMPQPSQAYLPNVPPQLPAVPAPSPPQTAMTATPVPAPVPSPEASAGYRALLSAWLESHKRYPDAARQRGEEGRAVLRFSVDRSGRVLDFAVTSSSGYPDLDQSVEEMMRGATLPPFPVGMPQREMQVSVTIRYSLRR
jgi:periplasmic protein TonB